MTITGNIVQYAVYCILRNKGGVCEVYYCAIKIKPRSAKSFEKCEVQKTRKNINAK